MPRLSEINEAELTPEQQKVLSAMRSGPRGGSVALEGPFGVWVRAPKIGMAVQAVGAAARYETSLDDAVRELAICVVGGHYKAKFEFAIHRAIAEQAGVSAAALDAIQVGSEPKLDDPAQALCYRVAHLLSTQHRLDDATYAEAISTFGEEGLIELVSVIGYYVLVSMTLNAFEVPIRAGMTDPFPGHS
jgi:4-carboxymuconolactone decarboxylase